jgi:diadenosine tetraphosphatase ApaH/serine/threonine PP2A family protein phosphatase
MKTNINEIRAVAQDLISILQKEKTLIRINTNDALIVGDTHGDVDTTLDALGYEADVYVFLGDYVDRGPYQIENMVELMHAKVEEPSKIILLRGNHETPSMNFGYGFYDVVSRRFGRGAYGIFAEVFAHLPIACIVNERMLLLHGGIPDNIARIEEIESIKRPEEEVTDPVAFQILWNDPTYYVDEFSPSPRGVGAKVFGRKALTRFLQTNSLEILIRAHEPVLNGYEYMFDKKLLTIFSCRYYGIKPCAARVKNNTINIQYL